MVKTLLRSMCMATPSSHTTTQKLWLKIWRVRATTPIQRLLSSFDWYVGENNLFSWWWIISISLSFGLTFFTVFLSVIPQNYHIFDYQARYAMFLCLSIILNVVTQCARSLDGRVSCYMSEWLVKFWIPACNQLYLYLPYSPTSLYPPSYHCGEFHPLLKQLGKFITNRWIAVGRIQWQFAGLDNNVIHRATTSFLVSITTQKSIFSWVISYPISFASL